VTITNRSSQPIELRTRAIPPAGLRTNTDEQTITLRPRQSQTVERRFHADDDLAPGYYHFFEEVRFNNSVRHGWGYAAHRAQPRLDLNTALHPGVRYTGGLEQLEQINLSSVRHVVFGGEASNLEVNWALFVHSTLRAATGSDIQRWAHDQISPEDRRRSLVLVGNQNSHPMIAELADRLPLNPLELAPGEGAVMTFAHPDDPSRFILVVSGADAEGIERAAADFIYRYWRFAKDAISFRDGPMSSGGM
jgi:hypothetical protein